MQWIKRFGLRISNTVPDRFIIVRFHPFFLCVNPNIMISILLFSIEKVILNRAPLVGQR